MSTNGGASQNIASGSQSRIKVNLSQNEEDTLGMTGMEDENIMPKPRLTGADSNVQMPQMPES